MAFAPKAADAAKTKGELGRNGEAAINMAACPTAKLVGPPGLEPGTNGFTNPPAFPPGADYLTALGLTLGRGTLQPVIKGALTDTPLNNQQAEARSALR